MKSVTLTSRDSELDPPDFLFAITRIAVAQICQSVGFKASQNSALETLTDIAAGYLQALAKSAAASATSSGRTQSNLFDIVFALEDLYSAQGFRGASNVNQPLLASSTLVDIMKFVKYTDEIPFAKRISFHYTWEQSLLPRNPMNYKGGGEGEREEENGIAGETAEGEVQVGGDGRERVECGYEEWDLQRREDEDK
ncbi:hypothetical protein F0562_029636 [Nyssa sinensis]|uniref:Bromodomain associated domain-containing protein n=1 Tax=Nyssa sinensis TaxID=561372 RepID=A0A5J5B3G0_9ASTE|nr:hypothetical protein F0562_029636 [Nyssa sinensis]